jgi:ankyrin repeat protein
LKKSFYNNIPVNRDTQDTFQNSPLHNAVLNNDIVMVRILINSKCQLNKQNDLGNTPLHIAVNKNYNDIIKILLDKKAKINIKNNKNKTVLDIARETNNILFAKYLR